MSIADDKIIKTSTTDGEDEEIVNDGIPELLSQINHVKIILEGIKKK